ncbi:hypothetical protein P154DRAFT_525782 [Amniculicola lignicola CBS 123094]|uniref:Capsule polysaccharide biosynthesis protein n=1 Tax=Amniculicola lignicola CBS 123094 TaxID=1392246 RepID=A0A6A5W2V0_9PLEO|nr:hypothetical protein P154DRAFT_525782 [Amniculicola lignicola CBS 123094]
MYPDIPNTVPITHTVLPPIGINEIIPSALAIPQPPTTNSKSIFAFWHSGIAALPPYLYRNVLAWHRRYSPLGWTIYVLDRIPGSPLNVSNYIDTTSPSIVPEAFTKGTLNGTYAAQHTSDLIRYPLLLKYGGVYLDVGILQFGDLDWLWTDVISNPKSPYTFAGFTMGEAPEISIVNFALVCRARNPLVQRAHHILLKVWEGKTNTRGMHNHPLVKHVSLLKVATEVKIDDEGQGKMVINDEVMTDYAIQIQCMGSAQRWLDEEGGWDGPAYVRENAWLLSMIDGAFMVEQMTNWSGKQQFDSLALSLPEDGEEDSAEQARARQLVEKVVGESWCLKLGHGFSAKLFGAHTLGMLWKENDGSDCGEGTYAGWLRWAEVHLRQVKVIEPMKVEEYEPTMKGRMPT